MYPNAAVAARHPVSWPSPWLKTTLKKRWREWKEQKENSCNWPHWIRNYYDVYHTRPSPSTSSTPTPKKENCFSFASLGEYYEFHVQIQQSLATAPERVCMFFCHCVGAWAFSIRKQHHFNFWPHAKTTILNFGILWVFEFCVVRSGIIFGVEWSHWMLQLDAMWFYEYTYISFMWCYCCCLVYCWVLKIKLEELKSFSSVKLEKYN